MILWLGFIVAAIAFGACALYACLGASDPEGRGVPHEGLAIGTAVLAALIAAGFVGALLHLHLA